MIYERSHKVFSCCGQYLVTTKATANKSIVCPRCGKKLEKAIDLPNMIVIKSS